jgi:hypothetical protein
VKHTTWVVAVLVVVGSMGLGAAAPDSARPQFTGDNQLLKPADYRDWIYLSSGLGMSYNPQAGGHDMFTNVFVPRWAYQEFLKSGTWPDQTMFVVEERGAESRGSINKHGHYQTTDLMGIGVEVKDKRLPDQWAYYNFDEDTKSAKANPKEGCFTCHESHAAVEHTFVQFYPTLKPVATKSGTYNAAREKVEDAK